MEPGAGDSGGDWLSTVSNPGGCLSIFLKLFMLLRLELGGTTRRDLVDCSSGCSVSSWVLEMSMALLEVRLLVEMLSAVVNYIPLWQWLL